VAKAEADKLQTEARMQEKAKQLEKDKKDILREYEKWSLILKEKEKVKEGKKIILSIIIFKKGK
jgi:hypothetical protein